MAQEQDPLWISQVEGILRKAFEGDELQERLKEATPLIKLVQEIELPTEDKGRVVAVMLKAISEDLRPLAAVYAGFQLGVAYERHQNANRT